MSEFPLSYRRFMFRLYSRWAFWWIVAKVLPGKRRVRMSNITMRTEDGRELRFAGTPREILDDMRRLA